ncbi:NUDIX domain-containing protein [Candidatus Terasakiella magnetica]|uniref:NUDIX domain-containing protein n=1 Tax=Candidatus Terasakiella magnetica TaxID=1867952 RepID=UPI0013F4D51B|nr:NUDIX hydrolase [Candidatus Terasakiella magnetica]
MPSLINDCALFSVSQKAIIKDKKGRILMMEKAGKSHWDIPGGKLDAGEDMAKSIAREILEEIGFDKVNVGDIIYAGRRSFEEKDKAERVMIFYACEIDHKFEKIKLSDEHSAWRMMSAHDIKDQKKYEINPVVRAALNVAFAKD